MKRPWPPKSFENDFYPPKNTKNGIHHPKNHENGPYPPKNEDPPPFGCFWHLPLVLCLFLKCSMYHEELPDPKKLFKLNRLQHEVLHIYVHAYSAYKNKILRIHIVTIHTFIKMDLKTPWFSLWSICVLFWWKVKKNLGCFLPSEVMSIQFLLFSYFQSHLIDIYNL